ncbi:ABC transporter substrate-binding protein [Marinivivus vitaminiproducens]|uniref:ABC transporter substrate-binding protein n=1 Tax=Marinivivus vitaminiproducens TaxID=3035935 RepID=UPI0027AAB8AA|nr:ABC transporter substrate-binding protein [Geminicoccaceae bacterium SCSIO 64248]
MRPGIGRILFVFAMMAGAMSVSARAETPSNQLVVGMTLANVLQMDPHDNSAYEKTHMMIQVYDRLLQMRADDETELEPLLAESWSFDEAGNLTLNLRDDAYFHSGNPVTADDVAYSLRRPLLAKLNSASEYREVGFTPENVTSLITAPDEHTVRIERPGATSLTILLYGALAQPSGAILDRQLIQENEVDGDYGYGFLKTNSAGSGRYTLTRWNPNEVVVLDRFDDHWSGPAEMRRIVVRHVPEAQAQRLQIERGDLDMAYTLNAADYAALDENPDVDVQQVVGDGFYHIAINTNHPILGNPDIRRALSFLVPYDGLQESVMPYFGEPWHRPIAKGKLGAFPEDLPVSYDVDKAKELLAKAGYPDGFEADILTLSQPPFVGIATAFQRAAAAAGVRINVVQGGGSVVYGQMRKRTFDMIVGRALGGKYGDPHSNVSNSIYNPDNSDASALQNYAWRCNFHDETLNTLIEQAAAEMDQAKRAELYHRIQNRYQELGPPYILVGQRIDPFAVRADVHGIVGHPSWTTRWDLATKG